jgi:hypothetical protein
MKLGAGPKSGAVDLCHQCEDNERGKLAHINTIALQIDLRIR